MKGTILLAHGGGGEESRELIEGIFRRYLSNPVLDSLEDSAVLPRIDGKVAFTTDSFTVSPSFFRGGNIGKLSVAGTVNDLSVTGARPLYLSAGFVIEEGFSLKDLSIIVQSMSEEAAKTGVAVVTGDTKIMPRGSMNGIVINTAGIGRIEREGLSSSRVSPGDVIIVSGTMGDHGACILAEREGLGFDLDLESDCASLWPVIQKVIEISPDIHAMRDPTRGGLAAVLNEWAAASGVEIEMDEEFIPLKNAVKGICELLGMDPLQLASEGRFIAALPEDDADAFIEILQSDALGKDARVAGRVISGERARVLLRSSYGTRRILEPPSGELLPRIC
jgi:hydrogenase expression/formation protein HypE